jgi:hypothetical protein
VIDGLNSKENIKQQTTRQTKNQQSCSNAKQTTKLLQKCKTKWTP